MLCLLLTSRLGFIPYFLHEAGTESALLNILLEQIQSLATTKSEISAFRRTILV